jgi:pimeloyl-ACP methyl ester carboxylesterase
MLVIILLGVGAAWNVVLVVLMAFAMLRPPRMGDGRAIVLLGRLSPADLGLQYEQKSYVVRDECTGRKLKIAAWWMENPQTRGKCAVIVHGYGDAKVGGIAWAPLLISLGFSVLAIDLRAHGESEGKNCTAGFWERHDLNQVLDQLRADRGDAVRQIILFGVSLGAAVCAATAATRQDISAVILECPFADYYRAAAYLAGRMGAPIFLFRKFSLRVAEWIGRCDFAQVAPVKMIPRISAPLMLIQSGDDPFVTPADASELRVALLSRPAQSISVHWGLEGVHHVVGLCDDPQGYNNRITDFLAQALPKAVEICDS